MDHRISAVVLAAGKGTRMRSSRAKVLHPVCGRPLAYYPVKRALDAGATRVVVVVGHQAEAVREALEAHLPGAPLVFVEQTEQLGTGHAVRCALPALETAHKVLILYGDVPLVGAGTLTRLVEAGREAPVALVTTQVDDPTGYGRIVRGAQGEVRRIVEHRDADEETLAIREINAGLYLVERELLGAAVGGLQAQNAQQELYLTDVVELASGRQQPVAAVTVEDPAEVAGVNDRVELARAATAMRRQINERLMREGVSFEDPETTYVDEGVLVGVDTLLGAGVHLKGRTTVGEAVEIRPYSIVEDATVGDRSVIGPFARLRPGTVLEAEVHVGNFVECKKAHLHQGVKANHLTYLGDAEIGARTNVGAGTITCNYDGVNKHKTTVGAGAFIGSNTALVAPVRIGDGAYVGAGSTITKDVPDESLGVARARQANLEGWARKKAPRKKA